jgi:hypothetical protein
MRAAARLLCALGLLCAAAAALAASPPPRTSPPVQQQQQKPTQAYAVPSPQSSGSSSSGGSGGASSMMGAAVAGSPPHPAIGALASPGRPAVTPLPAGRKRVCVFDFDDTLKTGACCAGKQQCRNSAHFCAERTTGVA